MVFWAITYYFTLLTRVQFPYAFYLLAGLREPAPAPDFFFQAAPAPRFFPAAPAPRSQKHPAPTGSPALVYIVYNDSLLFLGNEPYSHTSPPPSFLRWIRIRPNDTDPSGSESEILILIFIWHLILLTSGIFLSFSSSSRKPLLIPPSTPLRNSSCHIHSLSFEILS